MLEPKRRVTCGKVQDLGVARLHSAIGSAAVSGGAGEEPPAGAGAGWDNEEAFIGARTGGGRRRLLFLFFPVGDALYLGGRAPSRNIPGSGRIWHEAK